MVRKGFDQVDDPLADLAVFDFSECKAEASAICGQQNFGKGFCCRFILGSLGGRGVPFRK